MTNLSLATGVIEICEEDKLCINDVAEKIGVEDNTIDFKNNWFLINGNYYYFKNLNENQILNELLGSHIFNILGLETIQYKLSKQIMHHSDKEVMGLISENFRNSDYEYINTFYAFGAPSGNFEKDIEKVYALNKEQEDKKVLVSGVIKTFIGDYFINNYDRLANYILKKNKSTRVLSVAPLFDFEKCSEYIRPTFHYSNGLIDLGFPNHEIITYFRNNPEYIDTFKMLRYLNIESVIDNLEEENNIKFSSDIKRSKIESLKTKQKQIGNISREYYL